MLRALLLVALLLRLAPAPAMAVSHCAPEPAAATAEGGHHAHHAVPHGEEPSGHEECTHCPPSECARHAACELPASVACLESPSRPAMPSLRDIAAHAPPTAWSTAHAAPPTRPPASPLA